MGSLHKIFPGGARVLHDNTLVCERACLFVRVCGFFVCVRVCVCVCLSVGWTWMSFPVYKM